MCGRRWECLVGCIPCGRGDEEDSPKAVWYPDQSTCSLPAVSLYRVRETYHNILYTYIMHAYTHTHTHTHVHACMHTHVTHKYTYKFHYCLQYTLGRVHVRKENPWSQPRGRGKITCVTECQLYLPMTLISGCWHQLASTNDGPTATTWGRIIL